MQLLKLRFSLSICFTLITFCCVLLAFCKQVKLTREISELKKQTKVLGNDRDVCVRIIDLFASLNLDDESDVRLFNDLKRHAARPPYFSKQ